MTTLIRRNPNREMAAFRHTLDRFLNEDFFNTPSVWERNASSFRPAVDVVENDEGFIVKATVPGIAPEDIEITLNDNVLTIEGEAKSESEEEGEKWHVRERSYGKFVRNLRLPVMVDVDKIEAVNEHGVLTLTLPKAEEVKPKRIAIKSTVNGTDK